MFLLSRLIIAWRLCFALVRLPTSSDEQPFVETKRRIMQPHPSNHLVLYGLSYLMMDSSLLGSVITILYSQL